ncbi:MAG TPA: LysR family transcriptional regulator [Burkholderiaceae bacterium]|jgi:DNA-binding transcriptional LysR family regulator
MHLQRMEIFACVAEQGSLSKAAVVLGSVPSIVSRQVAALERECGGALFLRTGRGMDLTDLGRRILPSVQAMLAASRQLEEDIRSRDGVLSGEVRVGLVPSLTQPLVTLLFRQMQRLHPEVRLHIAEGSSGQLDAWRSEAAVDLALLFRYTKSEIQGEHVLGSVDNYLIGPHGDPLTAHPTVPFDRLDGLPLILSAVPNGLRVTLDQIAKKRNVTLRVVLEADALHVQSELVASACGHAIMAGHAAAREVGSGLLQASRIIDPSVARIVTLGITPRRPASPAVREVARIVRQIMEEAFSTMALSPHPEAAA